jgi:predicted ribosomally synthesized peptide with SipW-like signal peptide
MTRKILFSLLVIGAVVAAFGAITYAIFSDNVVSDVQEFAAGTVDIQVEGQDEEFVTTLDMDNMEPGDCSKQTVRVANVGTLPVHLWNWIYTWKPSGDPRPDIFNCDPNPACNMYVKKTLVAESDLDPDDEVDEKIVPTGWEDYELEACLPLCAGNNCQGAYGQMRLFFHAVQQSNLDGWNCVKLLYKEGPDWIPDPTIPAHGNKCYEENVGAGPNVDFVVNGYDLTPNMKLQVMLNGPGVCTAADAIIAGDYDFNGQVDPGNWDPYYRGYWNEGGALSQTCDPTKAGEGVYAIAHGGSSGGATPDPAAETDGNGDFSGQWTAHLDACAVLGTGTHTLQTKFLIKQDQSPWAEELDELDYQYITFVCPP